MRQSLLKRDNFDYPLVFYTSYIFPSLLQSSFTKYSTQVTIKSALESINCTAWG